MMTTNNKRIWKRINILVEINCQIKHKCLIKMFEKLIYKMTKVWLLSIKIEEIMLEEVKKSKKK